MSAPRFLRAEEWAVLKEQLKGEDNRNWLVSYLCQCVRDEVFRAFHSDDPLSKSPEVIKVVGLTLYTAIVNKLKTTLPKDSQRDESTLVRWNPDRAAILLEQAMGFLKDVWSKDVAKNPSDNIEARWLRLRPRLAVLPNMKGRSIHGDTSELFTLVIYKVTMELLEPLPRRTAQTRDELEDRRKKLTQIANALKQSMAKGQIPDPVTEAFDRGLTNKWTGIWTLPRNRIAVEIALRASGNSNTSPKHFLNQLKRLRKRAAPLKRLFPKSH